MGPDGIEAQPCNSYDLSVLMSLGQQLQNVLLLG